MPVIVSTPSQTNQLQQRESLLIQEQTILLQSLDYSYLFNKPLDLAMLSPSSQQQYERNNDT